MIKFTIPLKWYASSIQRKEIKKGFFNASVLRKKNPQSYLLISHELLNSTVKATSVSFDDTEQGTNIILEADSQVHIGIAAYLMGGITAEIIFDDLPKSVS